MPLQNCVMLAGPLLSHAQDHLQAMAVLADAADTVMASFSLVRSILSSAARVAYLLEPEVTVRERLRRGMNLQLESYIEQGYIASGGENEQVRRAASHFGERIDGILRGARQHDFHVSTPPKRSHRAPHIGAPHPKEMELVQQVLSDADNQLGIDIGRLVYRLSSASVHGQPHAMSMLVHRVVRRDAPQVAMAEFSLPLDTFVLFGSSAVLAVHQAALLTLAYAGLPASVWQDVAQPVLRTWQASIHAYAPAASRRFGSEPSSGGIAP
jgi:hypothetical protein